MNWLDSAINWVDPARGLRRVRARKVIDTLLAYEGATAGRRAAGWTTSGSSANAEIGMSLTKLRDRSRALVRDTTYGARAVNEIVVKAVGTGIIAKARVESEAFRKKIDDTWLRWVDECDADGQCDFYGLQRLLARGMVENGEALVRFRPRRPKDGMQVPLQLQVLESDYLDLSKTQPSDQYGNHIVQGVEFNAWGRRVAYWLFNQHPGDVTFTTGNFRGVSQSHRVPAEEVLHIYQKDRAGQVRGVPMFAPVLLAMRDLDEYEDAELMKKKIEACMAAFVTQPEGADGGGVGPGITDSESGQLRETLEPGMIERLKPGEEVTFGVPHNTAGYREFVNTKHGEIAAAFSMNAWQLNGDLSGINYSSFKAGDISFRGNIQQWRWLTFIPMFCQPAWNRFVMTAALGGVIPPQERVPVKWGPPRFESVDPEKDAKGIRTHIRSGLTTWPQAVGEQGWDPDEQLEEIKTFNAKMDKANIVLDCDPRKVTSTGAVQSEAQAPGENNGQAVD